MLLSFCINLCSSVTSDTANPAPLSRILLFQRCFWSQWVFTVPSKLIMYSMAFTFMKMLECWDSECFIIHMKKDLIPSERLLLKKMRCMNLKYLFVPLRQTRRVRKLKGVLVRQMFNFHYLYLLVSWLRESVQVSLVWFHYEWPEFSVRIRSVLQKWLWSCCLDVNFQ